MLPAEPDKGHAPPPPPRRRALREAAEGSDAQGEVAASDFDGSVEGSSGWASPTPPPPMTLSTTEEGDLQGGDADIQEGGLAHGGPESISTLQRLKGDGANFGNALFAFENSVPISRLLQGTYNQRLRRLFIISLIILLVLFLLNAIAVIGGAVLAFCNREAILGGLVVTKVALSNLDAEEASFSLQAAVPHEWYFNLLSLSIKDSSTIKIYLPDAFPNDLHKDAPLLTVRLPRTDFGRGTSSINWRDAKVAFNVDLPLTHLVRYLEETVKARGSLMVDVEVSIYASTLAFWFPLQKGILQRLQRIPIPLADLLPKPAGGPTAAEAKAVPLEETVYLASTEIVDTKDVDFFAVKLAIHYPASWLPPNMEFSIRLPEMSTVVGYVDREVVLDMESKRHTRRVGTRQAAAEPTPPDELNFPTVPLAKVRLLPHEVRCRGERSLAGHDNVHVIITLDGETKKRLVKLLEDVRDEKCSMHFIVGSNDVAPPEEKSRVQRWLQRFWYRVDVAGLMAAANAPLPGASKKAKAAALSGKVRRDAAARARMAKIFERPMVTFEILDVEESAKKLVLPEMAKMATAVVASAEPLAEGAILPVARVVVGGNDEMLSTVVAKISINHDIITHYTSFNARTILGILPPIDLAVQATDDRAHTSLPTDVVTTRIAHMPTGAGDAGLQFRVDITLVDVDKLNNTLRGLAMAHNVEQMINGLSGFSFIGFVGSTDHGILQAILDVFPLRWAPRLKDSLSFAKGNQKRIIMGDDGSKSGAGGGISAEEEKADALAVASMDHSVSLAVVTDETSVKAIGKVAFDKKPAAVAPFVSLKWVDVQMHITDERSQSLASIAIKRGHGNMLLAPVSALDMVFDCEVNFSATLQIDSNDYETKSAFARRWLAFFDSWYQSAEAIPLLISGYINNRMVRFPFSLPGRRVAQTGPDFDLSSFVWRIINNRLSLGGIRDGVIQLILAIKPFSRRAADESGAGADVHKSTISFDIELPSITANNVIRGHMMAVVTLPETRFTAVIKEGHCESFESEMPTIVRRSAASNRQESTSGGGGLGRERTPRGGGLNGTLYYDDVDSFSTKFESEATEKLLDSLLLHVDVIDGPHAVRTALEVVNGSLDILEVCLGFSKAHDDSLLSKIGGGGAKFGGGGAAASGTVPKAGAILSPAFLPSKSAEDAAGRRLLLGQGARALPHSFTDGSGAFARDDYESLPLLDILLNSIGSSEHLALRLPLREEIRREEAASKGQARNRYQGVENVEAEIQVESGNKREMNGRIALFLPIMYESGISDHDDDGESTDDGDAGRRPAATRRRSLAASGRHQHRASSLFAFAWGELRCRIEFEESSLEMRVSSGHLAFRIDDRVLRSHHKQAREVTERITVDFDAYLHPRDVSSGDLKRLIMHIASLGDFDGEEGGGAGDNYLARFLASKLEDKLVHFEFTSVPPDATTKRSPSTRHARGSRRELSTSRGRRYDPLKDATKARTQKHSISIKEIVQLWSKILKSTSMIAGKMSSSGGNKATPIPYSVIVNPTGFPGVPEFNLPCFIPGLCAKMGGAKDLIPKGREFMVANVGIFDALAPVAKAVSYGGGLIMDKLYFKTRHPLGLRVILDIPRLAMAMTLNDLDAIEATVQPMLIDKTISLCYPDFKNGQPVRDGGGQDVRNGVDEVEAFVDELLVSVHLRIPSQIARLGELLAPYAFNPTLLPTIAETPEYFKPVRRHDGRARSGKGRLVWRASPVTYSQLTLGVSTERVDERTLLSTLVAMAIPGQPIPPVPSKLGAADKVSMTVTETSANEMSLNISGVDMYNPLPNVTLVMEERIVHRYIYKGYDFVRVTIEPLTLIPGSNPRREISVKVSRTAFGTLPKDDATCKSFFTEFMSGLVMGLPIDVTALIEFSGDFAIRLDMSFLRTAVDQDSIVEELTGFSGVDLLPFLRTSWNDLLGETVGKQHSRRSYREDFAPSNGGQISISDGSHSSSSESIVSEEGYGTPFGQGDLDQHLRASGGLSESDEAYPPAALIGRRQLTIYQYQRRNALGAGNFYGGGGAGSENARRKKEDRGRRGGSTEGLNRRKTALDSLKSPRNRPKLVETGKGTMLDFLTLEAFYHACIGLSEREKISVGQPYEKPRNYADIAGDSPGASSMDDRNRRRIQERLGSIQNRPNDRDDRLESIEIDAAIAWRPYRELGAEFEDKPLDLGDDEACSSANLGSFSSSEAEYTDSEEDERGRYNSSRRGGLYKGLQRGGARIRSDHSRRGSREADENLRRSRAGDGSDLAFIHDELDRIFARESELASKADRRMARKRRQQARRPRHVVRHLPKFDVVRRTYKAQSSKPNAVAVERSAVAKAVEGLVSPNVSIALRNRENFELAILGMLINASVHDPGLDSQGWYTTGRWAAGLTFGSATFHLLGAPEACKDTSVSHAKFIECLHSCVNNPPAIARAASQMTREEALQTKLIIDAGSQLFQLGTQGTNKAESFCFDIAPSLITVALSPPRAHRREDGGDDKVNMPFILDLVIDMPGQTLKIPYTDPCRLTLACTPIGTVNLYTGMRRLASERHDRGFSSMMLWNNRPIDGYQSLRISFKFGVVTAASASRVTSLLRGPVATSADALAGWALVFSADRPREERASLHNYGIEAFNRSISLVMDPYNKTMAIHADGLPKPLHTHNVECVPTVFDAIGGYTVLVQYRQHEKTITAMIRAVKDAKKEYVVTFPVDVKEILGDLSGIHVGLSTVSDAVHSLTIDGGKMDIDAVFPDLKKTRVYHIEESSPVVGARGSFLVQLRDSCDAVIASSPERVRVRLYHVREPDTDESDEEAPPDEEKLRRARRENRRNTLRRYRARVKRREERANDPLAIRPVIEPVECDVTPLPETGTYKISYTASYPGRYRVFVALMPGDHVDVNRIKKYVDNNIYSEDESSDDRGGAKKPKYKQWGDVNPYQWRCAPDAHIFVRNIW